MRLTDDRIREPFFEYLEEQFEGIRILEEKRIGHSRADILLVKDEELIGIEIKSDYDTYTRLKDQIRDYDRYYDRNYVLVGKSHEKHVGEHIPAYWGILVAEESGGVFAFTLLRRAEKNPKVRMAKKITMLWRRELAHIQELYKLPAYKQQSKEFVQQKILAKMDPEELQKALCRELMERDYTTIAEEIAEYRQARKRKQRKKIRIFFR